MIEELLRNFLDENLSAPVFLNVPKDHPAEYYELEKTGGSRSDFIWESVFALKAYGETDYRAAVMIRDANNILLDKAIERPEISKVELNSTADFKDTEKKLPRYQSVFVVTHY